MKSRNDLLKEYKKYLYEAERSLYRNNIQKALKQIEYSTLIASYYPILYNFIDENAERILSTIAQKILKTDQINVNSSCKNRIVFYNGQILDSGALTEQYLTFFEENGFEVLFIVKSKENTLQGCKIIKRVQENNNFTIFIPETNNNVEAICQIVNKIKEFSPTSAFLHFLPNDIVGFCSFVLFDDMKRYYIIHNDHTFWLGKKCSDIFIEFRNFGYKLSIERRKLSQEATFIIPFYPINTFKIFKGLPFNRDNKIVGFSAANLYKYFIDPELNYFKVIKKLLNENEDFIFCLAGYGDVKYTYRLKLFIKDHNLEDRFYFLGKRDDFYALVGNIDILFESYPLRGGLTLLYATEQYKAVTGIGSPYDTSCLTEDFLGLNHYKQPRTLQQFYIEATKLIRDEEYRSKIAVALAQNDFNKISFTRSLNALLSGTLKHPQIKSMRLKLNDELVFQEYERLDSYKYSIDQYKYLNLKGNIGYIIGVCKAINYHGIAGLRSHIKSFFNNFSQNYFK
jgi:hypothetical protein